MVTALENIEKNTEFRISAIERSKSVDRRLENIESKVEILPEMFTYMKQWESSK